MNNQYYFVGTSLPELELGKKPEIDWQQLKRLLKDNLSDRDYQKIKALRGFFDILNLRAVLKNEPIDLHGNLSINEIEEALLGDTNYFPSFVNQFLIEHESKKDRLYYFPKLMHDYYNQEMDQTDLFFKKYLSFERQLRLILTAYRAKKLNKDLLKELQFEEAEDPFIYQLLMQKDAKIFVMPEGFEDLKPIVDEHFNSPIQLYQQLMEYRFKFLDKLTFFDAFSIDRIITYVAKYFMLENYMALDEDKGLKIVDTIIKGQS